MKKLFGLMLLCATMVCSTSCEQGDDNVIDKPKEVEFSIDYTFAESGSMTRMTGEDVYTNFYNTYIKSKKLTPTTYSFTFTNNETGAKMNIDGQWNSEDMIRLMEGVYSVEGISHRVYNESLDLHSEYVSDTTFLCFRQDVKIQANQTKLNLTAQYDSYLLMFDANSISDIRYNGIKTWKLQKHDDLSILFINRQSDLKDRKDNITIQRTNGTKITVYLKDIPFEKGKYYYFNDMTNSFDIPPMESGN